MYDDKQSKIGDFERGGTVDGKQVRAADKEATQ
jgi:hypothetical protein